MVEKRFGKLGMPDIERFENYLPTAFNSELTLLQKVNKIIFDLIESNKLTNEMVDYLNNFIETFDENLYETIDDILSKWLEDGVLTKLIRDTINEEVVEARNDYSTLKERLDSEKGVVDTQLSQLTHTTASLESDKVDKNGQMQVKWANIAQDARENITGGSTAVVGENSVGTTNIIDKSVSIKKLKDNVNQSLYSWTDLKIDGDNATIKSNGRYIVFQSMVTGKSCTIVTTEDYLYTLTNNERLVLKWDSTVDVTTDLSVLTTKPATTQLAIDEHVILGFNVQRIFSEVSNFDYTIKSEQQPENHELFLWRDVTYDGSTNTFNFGNSPVFQNYLNGEFVYFIDEEPLTYQLETEGKLVLVWDGQETINPASKDTHLKVVPINTPLANYEIPIATRIGNLITSPIPFIQQAIFDYTIKSEHQPENHELFLWRDVTYDGSTNTFNFGNSPVFQSYLSGKFVYFIDEKPLTYQLETEGKLVLVWDGQETINPASKDTHLKVVPIPTPLAKNEIPIATRIGNLITSPIPFIQQAIFDYDLGQIEIPKTVEPLKVKGSLSELAPTFYGKYLAQEEDVTVVLNGDSISTTNYYTAPRDDAKNRPPLMVEHAYVTAIEEQLRWDGQKYYRYDTGVFTENATTKETKEYDLAWDEVKPNGEQWRNNRPALTRILEGTNVSVSYIVPDGVKRCDFIYRTDYLNADSATVTVSASGVLEVYDETTEAWVEANGYTYSAKEDGTLLPGSIYKSIYQKRLKMKVVGSLNNTVVTITNNGTGRLTYWGIQTGIREVMFDFILSARGGHNIKALEYYEEWDTDYYKPQLIMWEIPIINENLDVANSDFTPKNMTKNTTQYASNILTKANEYLAKPYHPELVSWVMFFGKENYAIDDNNEWVYGVAPDGSKVSVPNYINKTLAVLKTNNVNVLDLFRLYLDYSLKVSDSKGVPLHEAVFQNGMNGDAMSIDGAHFNTKGAEVTMDIFDSFFLQ